MRKILWILFVLLSFYMSYQGLVVRGATKEHYRLLKVQSADSTLGRTMFQAWKQVCYGRGDILSLVQSNTHTDFWYIATYTLLLMFCSTEQMQNETFMPLNSLLRLNLVLAIAIAFLDVFENKMILYNIEHFQESGRYFSPYIVSTSKWLLAGWAVLVWLVSLFRSTILKN